MPIPFAIVGPGRLGTALARRWSDAGLQFLGFRGRDAARTADALAFVGTGSALDDADLGHATVVALTVSDAALETVAAALARAGAARRSSLWLHTSGCHDLAPLNPLATACGARIGALHPLAPVPDRENGVRSLEGRHALLEGPAESLGLLRTLAERAGMRPIVAPGHVDRALYHAACALAANGTTALLDVATDLLAAATSVDHGRAAALAGDLAGASCALVAERGAAAALSGPVVRGDAAVLRAHFAALDLGPRPDAAAIHRALMRVALRLAEQRGLAAGLAAEVAAALDGGERLD